MLGGMLLRDVPDKMFCHCKRTCLDVYIIQRSSLQLTWIDCAVSSLKHWNWHLKDLLHKPVNIRHSSGRRTEKYSSTFSWRKQNSCILSEMINMSFVISERSSTINFSLHYNTKGNIHPLLRPITFQALFCRVEGKMPSEMMKNTRRPLM